jgi:hypothetical protein
MLMESEVFLCSFAFRACFKMCGVSECGSRENFVFRARRCATNARRRAMIQIIIRQRSTGSRYKYVPYDHTVPYYCIVSLPSAAFTINVRKLPVIHLVIGYG